METVLVEKMSMDVPDYRVFPSENPETRKLQRHNEIRRRYGRAMSSFGPEAEKLAGWLMRKYKTEERLINHLSLVVQNITGKYRHSYGY